VLSGFKKLIFMLCSVNIEGHAVAQLVEALRYKPEGRWNFSLA
jgi:hypothetical protein